LNVVLYLQVTKERIREIVLAEDFRELSSMLKKVGMLCFGVVNSQRVG
jgi:hypothetical protein